MRRVPEMMLVGVYAAEMSRVESTALRSSIVSALTRAFCVRGENTRVCGTVREEMEMGRGVFLFEKNNTS